MQKKRERLSIFSTDVNMVPFNHEIRQYLCKEIVLSKKYNIYLVFRDVNTIGN